MATTDWITSFQALTDNATSSYEHLLTQWQDLLRQVARGELVPASLSERLPQFLREQGGEFYRRLSSLSFDLFQGLSEVQGSYAEDFLRGMLGDSAGPRSPSPTSPEPPAAEAKPEEWTQWSQAVTSFLAAQNEGAMMRYQVLLEKVAAGKLTPASVQEYSRKFMNERALVVARDSGGAQLRFYERLQQLNQDFVAQLFSALVQQDSTPRPTLEIQPLEFRPTAQTSAPPKRARKSSAGKKRPKKKASR